VLASEDDGVTNCPLLFRASRHRSMELLGVGKTPEKQLAAEAAGTEPVVCRSRLYGISFALRGRSSTLSVASRGFRCAPIYQDTVRSLCWSACIHTSVTLRWKLRVDTSSRQEARKDENQLCICQLAFYIYSYIYRSNSIVCSVSLYTRREVEVIIYVRNEDFVVARKERNINKLFAC